MLTVVGTSFATLSTANGVNTVSYLVESPKLKPPKIFNVLYSNGTCPSTTGEDGAVTRLPCPDAYGYLIGLILVYLESKYLTTQQEHHSYVLSSRFSCLWCLLRSSSDYSRQW